MRGFLRARDTASWVAVTFLGLLSCGPSGPPRAPPRDRAPPNVLVVALDQVALRTTAWVELHGWLASAARTGSPLAGVEDVALNEAARAYGRALERDARDERLLAATHALEACEDETCARTALATTPFATFGPALPDFIAHHWAARATVSRASFELVRSAIGPDVFEVEPLGRRLAVDLAIAWPARPAVIDVVVDAPAPGGEAPVAALLGARSRCLERERRGTPRMHDARVFDCVYAYAAVRLGAASPLHDALVTSLGDAVGERAWTLVVIHASAMIATGWEPKHASVLRQSAAAVAPRAMAWLVGEWPARMRGEPPASFARRFADADTELRRPR